MSKQTSQTMIQNALEICEQEGYDPEETGMCTACGELAESVEPDAEDYRCVSCGQYKVSGLFNLLLGAL